MPVLKLYQNGLTAGIAPTCPNRNPPKRGDCEGWTLASSRSNTRFLYSVVSDRLPFSSDGRPLIGVAASLTVRDLPASHLEWANARRALLERFRRRGLERVHWLTEWQKRGVPHMHLALWFDREAIESKARADRYPTDWPLDQLASVLVVSDWIPLSARWGALSGAQHVQPINGELGWLQYLSKHASRGAAHYQRALGHMPEGWVKTGRMWGHKGDFPSCEPAGLELDWPGWFAFRRIVRGWRIAQARAACRQAGKGRRISLARRMLQAKDRALCTVRGVSEWIPLALGLTVVEFLARTHEVTS